MAPLLQFLDSHVDKLFKDAKTEKWPHWIANGEPEHVKRKTENDHSANSVLHGYLKYIKLL